MAVYIDNMNAGYRGMIMNHMVADSQQELLEMCDKIGVQRKWIQDMGTNREHFDICLSKKEAAIKAGAIHINMRELAKMTAERKDNNSPLNHLLINGNRPESSPSGL